MLSLAAEVKVYGSQSVGFWGNSDDTFFGSFLKNLTWGRSPGYLSHSVDLGVGMPRKRCVEKDIATIQRAHLAVFFIISMTHDSLSKVFFASILVFSKRSRYAPKIIHCYSRSEERRVAMAFPPMALSRKPLLQ